MRRSPFTLTTCALLLVAAASLALPDAAEAGKRELPYADVQGPAQSLIASAVYPGLGQLLNDSEHKAAIVGGAEAFLVARLLIEDRWTRHSFRLYQETGQSRYFNEYSEHFDTRQTLIWWVVVAALYGIADAYVDAHLMGFDDMRPDALDEWSERPGDDALRIGFACRF